MDELHFPTHIQQPGRLYPVRQHRPVKRHSFVQKVKEDCGGNAGAFLCMCAIELDAYDAKIEELNVDAALNYATDALRNAARFWMQCSADQKQNFQRVVFPENLVFDGESYRTAPTCIAAATCREFQRENQVWCSEFLVLCSFSAQSGKQMSIEKNSGEVNP